MKKEYLVRVGGVDGLIGMFKTSTHEEAIDGFNEDVEVINEDDSIEVFELKDPTKYIGAFIYKKVEEGPKGKNGKTK